MHFSRLILTGSTVLALSLAAGCSDDPDSPADDASPTGAATTAEQQASKSRDCKVDVTVSGAVEATWKGEGQAQVQRSAGPPAFYQASKGENSIAVYAEGEDFERSAVVSVGGATFTTEQGADGVEARPNGRGASVDADATGVDPDSQVRIVATFTC